MRHVIGRLAVTLAVVLSFAGAASAAEILRVNTLIFGDAAAVRAVQEVFVPEVKKVTEGRYEVQFFFAGELGGNQESIQQVRDGSIFATIVSAPWLTSTVPEIGVGSLPFLFPDRETAFRVFDGPEGQALVAKLADKGFTNLGFMELGFRHLTNAKLVVDSPDDLAGLKIRLQADPIHMETFRTLGANPIQIDGKELFASLRQGVADGQENPYVIIELMKMYEANQKYVTESGHFYDIMPFIASKKIMDAIPEPDRSAILAAGRKTITIQREMSGGDDAKNKAALAKNGMVVTELTPAQRQAFIDATAPVYAVAEDLLGAEFVRRFVAAVRQ